ncbi:MAG TPA: hypothetical protein VFK47_04670, partial [Ktedonobacteraceae bacterium]|nr:hypothetical protein [Ktedonobacteraceae bacterium]
MNNKKQERLQVLENQVTRLHRRLAILNQRSNKYSWIRLAIFLGGFAISVIVYILFQGWWFIISGVLFLTLFNIVAYYHRQIERSITRHKIWLRIKATQIARIQLDWSNIPPVQASSAPGDHPFASDLDITGERSLHQLINTAISYEGSQRIRDWLLQTTPDLDTIQARQALVQELAPLTRFRDKLTMKSMLASGRVNEHLEGKRLQTWLAQQPAATPQALRATLVVSSILSVLTLMLIILNIVAILPPQYWILSLLAAIGWLYARRNERGDLFEDAYFIRDAFSQLSGIFAFLETYPYGKHEHVKKLCEPYFSTPQHRPSLLLKKLSRIAAAATLEKNQFFWL